jgi:hypothetical protein
MTSCGYTHVVLDTDIGVAHLADPADEPLCGEHLRHPTVTRAMHTACPELAVIHCVACEGVLAGNAAVVGGELTAV